MSHRDNYKFLTLAPVGRVILTMSVPTVISMLMTSFYNVVTTFYAGRLNTQATAAVGICFSAMAVIQAVGFFFGQGSGTFISRQLGARKKNVAARMAVSGVFFSFVFSALLAVVGIFFLNPLAILLGSTPSILPYAKTYLLFVLLAAPFWSGSLTLINQLRYQGNALYAMFGILSGAIINVALAPFLMFYCHMGILGAGIATFSCQAFSFFFMLLMTRFGGNLPLSFSHITFSRVFFCEIFAGGLPSLTRQGLASISVALLNVAAGVYGDVAIAAMSIVSRFAYILFAIVMGVGQGFQPLCGFCYGARLFSRVRAGYWFVVKVGVVFMLLSAGVASFYANSCIRVFCNQPQVVSIGVVALRWQLVALPLTTIVMYTNMMLQVSRMSVRASILASARNGLFFIPLIIILPHFWGLFGVQVSQAVADVLSFFLAVPFAFSAFRDMQRIDHSTHSIHSSQALQLPQPPQS